MKKLTLAFTFVLAFSLILTLGCQTGYAAEYELRLGHVENTSSVIHKTAVEFKNLVEERTDGEVAVTIFPNSQLGSGTEQVKMIQTGSLNMGIIPAGHMGSVFAEIQIFDIPFLLPGNLEDANKVINGPAADQMFSYLGDKNLVGVANFALGLKQYTANVPIRTPADFDGLKFRTMASPLIIESFKLLDANPTVVDYHELYTALQLGQVVGHENPYWGIGRMKFHEVQDYVIESNHGLYTNTLLASKKWFDSLPAGIQETIFKAGEEVTHVAWKGIQEVDQEFRQTIQDDPNTELIVLTAEERSQFRETLEPVKDLYVERLGESGQQILDAFVEESMKYIE